LQVVRQTHGLCPRSVALSGSRGLRAPEISHLKNSEHLIQANI